MAATGQEIRPRQFTDQSVTRKYWIYDAADETEAYGWLTNTSNVPATVSGLPVSGIEANEHDDILGDYIAVVTYGHPESPQGSSTPGTAQDRFNFTAPSGQIMQSLATISGYYDDDLLFGLPDFGGAINVVNDGGKQRVEGFNLQPPAEVFTKSYTDVATVIDSSYRSLLRNLCGKVNSTEFEGAAAGEVMLVRAQGELKSGLWNLDFGFGYIENTTGEAYGNMTGISKDGMDLLWFYYIPRHDDTAREITKRPAAAFVERVWRRADLNDLALPS